MSNVENLVQEAEKAKNDVEVKDVKYGVVTYGNSHLHRIGQGNFEPVQVDDLSFVPLSDKVLQILTGNPSFHAEELDPDYDEEVSDNWDNVDEDNLDVFPIDEYSDKIDVLEVQADNAKRGEVIQTAVKELQDKESKKETKVEKPSENSAQDNSTENK